MTQIKIERRFRQIQPESQNREGYISNFFDRHMLIVLGEPGLGKTTSFISSADTEPNSVFIRLGEFLCSLNIEVYDNKVLYLDGLDEHRSKSNGKNVIDEIIGRLRKLNFPKVRISCRTAEWHGGQDINAFTVASNGQGVTQLELLPLLEAEYLLLLPEGANYKDFLDGAKENGLSGYLNNPQDFIFLWQQFSERKSWPKNRRELMEGALKILIKENNLIHSADFDDLIKEKELLEAAKYLSAIFMLSGISGINTRRPSLNDAFPIIHEFDGNLHAMKAAATRRVFKQIEGSIIEPEHRKVAEFMAAGYLADRVRQGLPLRRVIALLTGIDGGVAPDLRGTYAWFVTLLSGVADEILVHDPYGAILYGEPRSWTPNTKICALKALHEYAKKDPWFRGSDWFRADIAGLSDSRLEEVYRRYLKEDNCQSHFLGVMFEALSKGGSLPGIGDDLLEFINADKPEHLKEMAIESFWATCIDRRSELVKLLNEINIGNVSDEGQYLRGILLEKLYPEFISPSIITNYLVKPSSHIIGTYFMLFDSVIIAKTDIAGCRELFINIDKIIDKDFGNDEYKKNGFIAALIASLFKDSNASINDRLNWLIKGLDQYGGSRLRSEKVHSIRNYLSTNESDYFYLFIEFYNYFAVELRNDSWQYVWKFQELTLNVSPPETFVEKLLGVASLDENIEKALVFFGVAARLFFHSDVEFIDVGIESFESILLRGNNFKEEFEKYSICTLEHNNYRQEQVKRKIEQEEKKKQSKENNRIHIFSRINAVENGVDLAILEFSAKIWLGTFIDLNKEISPKERLVSELGEDIAKSILLGFEKVVFHEKNFNSLQEVAIADVNHTGYSRSDLLMAAIDYLTDSYREFERLIDLPENVIKAAIAYQMSKGGFVSTKFVEWLVEKLPALFEASLQEYWEIQICKKGNMLSAFHNFRKSELAEEIVKKVVVNLLTNNPNPNENILKELLLYAVKIFNVDLFLEIIEAALKNKFSRNTNNRALWLAVGFLMDENKYKRNINNILKTDQKWAVKDILSENILKRDDNGFIFSIAKRKSVVEALCPVFDNIPFSSGSGWVGVRDESTTAHSLRSLVHSFSQDASDEATLVLNSLLSSKMISQWHGEIQYTLANQIRLKREVRFKYPEVKEVVSTLSNSEPANPADLRALVMNALQDIQFSVRNSNTDKYKAYWVTDSHHGKIIPENHIGENEARNRILDELRAILWHLDITIEPEAQYVEEKRADIAVYCKGMKLPIEIKRDDHPEVWTAAQNQLEKQYTRDPASEGNGIYLVIWFDGKGMKNPPQELNLRRPANAGEFKQALEFTVPEASSGLIDVMVLDVEPPDKDYKKKR